MAKTKFVIYLIPNIQIASMVGLVITEANSLLERPNVYADGVLKED